MNKIIITLLLLFAATFQSCEPLNLEIDVPSCIEREIRQMKRDPVTNPPAAVYQWETEGKIYYYITSDCCDQYNWLYDTSCDVVCAPDGGFTGMGDGNCPQWTGTISQKLVWRDSRK